MGNWAYQTTIGDLRAIFGLFLAAKA